MDYETCANLKALEGHSIARIDVLEDSVEIGVPESEGWRVVIAAALDEHGRPTLVASWDPGLRRRHPPRLLEPIIAPIRHRRRRRAFRRRSFV